MFLKPIPQLSPGDIEVKIKQVTPKGAVALLYKTARTDMRILDECVGPENWQDSYQEIKGNLYCTIQIRNPKTGEWVGKTDCGIESREDGEGNQKKGEASDAFKRAGFKWGIGRELYTAPFLFLNLETREVPGPGGKKRYELVDRFARFSVKSIGYREDGSIGSLTLMDQTGKEVFRMGPALPVKASLEQKSRLSQELSRVGWSMEKAMANLSLKENRRMSEQDLTGPQCEWLVKFLQAKPDKERNDEPHSMIGEESKLTYRKWND